MSAAYFTGDWPTCHALRVTFLVDSQQSTVESPRTLFWLIGAGFNQKSAIHMTQSRGGITTAPFQYPLI